jgi:hypothetical protein
LSPFTTKSILYILHSLRFLFHRAISYSPHSPHRQQLLIYRPTGLDLWTKIIFWERPNILLSLCQFAAKQTFLALVKSLPNLRNIHRVFSATTRLWLAWRRLTIQRDGVRGYYNAAKALPFSG